MTKNKIKDQFKCIFNINKWKQLLKTLVSADCQEKLLVYNNDIKPIAEIINQIKKLTSGCKVKKTQSDDKLDLILKEVVQLNHRMDNVQGEIVKLNHRMDNVEGEIVKLNHRMDDVEGEIVKLNHRMGNLENRIDSLEDRIDGLENRMTVVEKKLEKI